MDHSAISLEAQNEIRFLVSLLRISCPGETASRAAGTIERMLISRQTENK